jgi:2-dehydro-3-deoxyphosphogluconate aldolase/(4S)-4-hydroxy-2-oxoglutarate aldolase
MTEQRRTLDTILSGRLIAVIRLDDPRDARAIADAIVDGGIGTIEITLTTPGAFDLIAALADHPGVLIGAGSVMTIADAARAFAGGAMFYASPVADPALIALAHEAGRVAMPGAYTPSEIVAAARAGADLVKIFPMPADPVAYLRAVRGPIRDVLMAPSGGVNLDTARPLLDAGAAALNVGSWLTHAPDGTILPLSEIEARARRMVVAVRETTT